MSTSLQSSGRRGRVYLFWGVFALGGVFAALQGAQTSTGKGSITLKRDDQAVNRGQMEPASFSTIVKKVSPSVVTINVQGRSARAEMPAEMLNDPFLRQFFGGRIPQQMQPRVQAGLGSGVIISPDGYIATNNHVVESADKITVTLSDGRIFKDAKLVGRDPDTEVAVIKVEGKDLPAVTMADSSKVEVGDRVLAIGNPFGIGETVTSGIVSATGRQVGIMDRGGLEDFIQTDASINPGNSGGALIDVQGRLIGLNTAIIGSGASNGVGLAVPSNIVSHVANSLVTTGKVVRGFLGVGTQYITPDLMEAYELKSRAGALIASVEPGMPADKAGIKVDDVILSVDGRPVADANKLSLIVSQIAPGTTVDLEVFRDGATKHLKATTVAKPTQDEEVVAGNLRSLRRGSGNSGNGFSFDGSNRLRQVPAAPSDDGVLNGVTVDDLDRATRRQLNIPESVNGALITQVDPASKSAEAGLKRGQVILSINRKPVANAEEAVKLSEDATSRKTLVRLWSPDGTTSTVVDESGPQ